MYREKSSFVIFPLDGANEINGFWTSRRGNRISGTPCLPEIVELDVYVEVK